MRWIWTYLRSMGSNFHEVVKGELYRGATPEPKNLKKWKTKYNIRTWIDLRLPSDRDFGSPVPTDRTRLYNAQRKACQELGIDHIRIPISDREPTSDFDIERCLRLMADSSNHPLFIACQGGRHRAGQMVALYGQRVLGWTDDKVKDSLKQGGFYPNGHERFARSLEKLLGFTLLLLCLVVPASGQTTEKAWYPLTINGPSTTSEGGVQIGSAPVFTADPLRVIYDVTVVERSNPIRGALAGVRSLRPPKIRGDQSESVPWWDNPYLHFVPASFEIPLTANEERGDRAIAPGHPWLAPDIRSPVHTQTKSDTHTDVSVELDALHKATARPKSVYGADSRRYDRTYWLPFGLAVASSLTDWHSTSGGLARGGREANPVFRTNGGRGVRYGANVAATAAFLGYTAWAEKLGHRRVARILLWTLTGLRFTASAWNYSVRR